MPSQGTFRNVNILSEITKDNASEAIDIYTPGLLSPYDINVGLKYSGFVTSLRLMVDINSIGELVLPSENILDTDADKQAKQREAIYDSPRKSICLYLRNSNEHPILVGEVFLFNRVPYYFVPLLTYFTDAATFDCAADTVITLQMKDVGYGLLEGNDRISIVGSAVEEAAYIEPNVLTTE